MTHTNTIEKAADATNANGLHTDTNGANFPTQQPQGKALVTAIPKSDKGVNFNTHPALDFLQALDSSPGATFNIEHYTDIPKGDTKPNPDPLLGRNANLSLKQVEALLPQLRQVNEAGAGVFVTVNQCEGQRSKSSIVRIRGAHADLDGASQDELCAIAAKLHPSIVVQSSSSLRCHFYFLLADGEALDVVTVEGINRHLVTLGADSAATDASRLLRLPGFKHMKYRASGQTPMVNAECFQYRYTADQLKTAFPPIAKRQKEDPAITPAKDAIACAAALLTNRSTLVRVADAMRVEHPELWLGQWQRATAKTTGKPFDSQSQADMALLGRIARECRSEGIQDGDLFDSIRYVFDQSGLAKREKWMDRPDYRVSTIGAAIQGSVTTTPRSSLNVPLDSHGDIRNAKAFAFKWRGKLLYVTSRGAWLRWDEQRWQLCEKGEQDAYAKEVCTELLTAASTIFKADQDKGKKLIQDAVASHNLPKITAMLKLAVSEPEMAVTDRELDADPMVLGAQNGVVDLKTGHLLFNYPEMRVTRFCNAAFIEGAACPKWIAFLDQVFQGDEATVESVQRLLGYTLTGLVTEEILVICFGYGSNGKSVFNNIVLRILGGYSRTAPATLLTARRADDTGPRNDVAALAGTRYVSINELQAGDRLDEQVVKMLAGREPISARYLHQEFFEFLPTFKAWLRTNHKPIITGEDDGIWRRLVPIPFRRKFGDDEKNPFLEEELLEERDGILQWMLEGTRRYLKDGLKLSPTIRAEHSSYRKASDLLGEFLADKTTTDPNSRVPQAGLFLSWKYWCDSNGVRHGSKKTFTQRMAERGFLEGRSNGERQYCGLSL